MKIIALEYHDVVQPGQWDESGFPGGSAATYKLPIDLFREHVDILKLNGVSILNEITSGIRDAAESPAVVLTFDDGGSGYLAYAADLLEANGWRGHLFMTTGRIGSPGFLTAGNLRDLKDRGHVIGSHSQNHPARLSAVPRGTIDDEWRRSVADLQDVLGSKVNVASVPGGYHSRSVAESAAANGIATLFTSEPVTRVSSVDGCAVVGRFTLRSNDSATYVARLVGRAANARVAQWCRWNAKKVAKAVGGTYYLRIRKQLLGG